MRQRGHGGVTTARGLGAAALLTLTLTSLAAGGTGDALREAVRNGTTSGETEIIGDIAASTEAKGEYLNRQSNVATGDDAPASHAAQIFALVFRSSNGVAAT